MYANCAKAYLSKSTTLNLSCFPLLTRIILTCYANVYFVFDKFVRLPHGDSLIPLIYGLKKKKKKKSYDTTSPNLCAFLEFNDSLLHCYFVTCYVSPDLTVGLLMLYNMKC